VGRDEAGRAPVRSFRGGYRRRLNRAPKADGGEECVRAGLRARSAPALLPGAFACVTLSLRSHNAPRSSDEEEGGGRGPRVAPVREPEPLNDFERARLENIRRNQEALAGARGESATARALLLCSRTAQR
jgi:hypothetical protein